MIKKKHTVSESALLRRIGDNIRQYRKKAGISQEELADKSNTERAYMGNIERGVTNATILKLKKVADALSVDASDFFKMNKK
jgi:transcriptional regulator with XRE-family HTH domain